MHYVPTTVGFSKHEPIEAHYRGDEGLTSMLFLPKNGVHDKILRSIAKSKYFLH